MTRARRRGARVLCLCLPLIAAGCTTSGDTVRPGTEPDLSEAARINTQLGIEYLRKGEDKLALEKLEKALEQDDDQAMAHSVIAFLYQRRGESELAERHYRKALSRNDEDPLTLNNYGAFLCARGEWRKATRLFVESAGLRSNTTPEDAWANAGTCLRTRDPAQAEAYLREALKINARHPNALVQMAELTYEKKDFLRARAFLQRYQAVARDTAQTLFLAARTERALGDAIAARTYERRLRTEFPAAPENDRLAQP